MKISCALGEEFGCEEAVVLAHVTGTTQWQWLCAQHWEFYQEVAGADKAPDQLATIIRSLREDLERWRLATLCPDYETAKTMRKQHYELRATVEMAPHDRLCAMVASHLNTLADCDCWKKEALKAWTI